MWCVCSGGIYIHVCEYVYKIWSFCDHTCDQEDNNTDARDTNDAITRWSIHDCTGSLAFMPNGTSCGSNLNLLCGIKFATVFILHDPVGITQQRYFELFLQPQDQLGSVPQLRAVLKPVELSCCLSVGNALWVTLLLLIVPSGV